MKYRVERPPFCVYCLSKHLYPDSAFVYMCLMMLRSCFCMIFDNFGIYFGPTIAKNLIWGVLVVSVGALWTLWTKMMWQNVHTYDVFGAPGGSLLGSFWHQILKMELRKGGVDMQSDNACACFVRVVRCRFGSISASILESFWEPSSPLYSFLVALVAKTGSQKRGKQKNEKRSNKYFPGAQVNLIQALGGP